MKAIWALYEFSDAEKQRALDSLPKMPEGWRAQRGVLMDDDGVRTGQVALRTHGAAAVVTTLNARDRLHVVARLSGQRKTG